MDNSFIYTIVLSFENLTLYDLKILDSIIYNQTLDFKENVQLIIKCCDNYLSSYLLECKSQFPDNIILINNDKSCSYQDLCTIMGGKYIFFMEDNVILSNNALNYTKDVFDNYNTDVVFLLNKEFLDSKYPLKDNLFFDLRDKNTLIPLNNAMYFINGELFKDIVTKYHDTDLWAIVMKIISIKKYHVVLNESSYSIQYLEAKNNHINKNDFYLNKLKNFYLNILDYSDQKYSTIPRFIQESIIYQLSEVVEYFEVKSLSEDDKKYVFNLLNQIISQVDFNTILHYSHIDYRKKNFLLYLHNEYKILLEINDNGLDLKIKNHVVDNLNRHKLWLDLVDINDDVLNLSGLLQSNFSNEFISTRLISKKNNKKTIFDCTLSDYNQDERKNISYLSINWIYRYNFNFEIPIGELLNNKLYFEVNYDDGKTQFSYLPEVAFRAPASLSTSSIYSMNKKYILYFKDNSFYIRYNNYALLLRLELSNIRKIFKDKHKGYLHVIFLRMLYVLLCPLMNKKSIWLFNDRLNFADDNALVLFKYSLKKKDGCDKYFIISADSEDYLYLKNKYSNIIKFGSFKHRLLYLFADKVIYSFVNEDYSNPFHIPGYLQYKQLYSGLFTFKRYFLQHGVTLGDYSNSIKKYNMNLSLIVASNNLEAESYKKSSYGFNREIVQVLGLPRYDNLDKTTTKKQIVYMPTWRSYLNFDEDLFKNSKFFKTLNDLLNNKKLHQLLKNYGYEFIFKPHPELYKYIHNFNLDGVKLSDESYNTLFNESAILITDYSSVAFDFAYLKKPVIYYQNSHDYHYKEGYFDFHTMGFGEIISNESDLLKKIEHYIKNECVMEEKYQNRIDEFFSYHDKNNCQRVYSWIKNN